MSSVMRSGVPREPTVKVASVMALQTVLLRTRALTVSVLLMITADPSEACALAAMAPDP